MQTVVTVDLDYRPLIRQFPFDDLEVARRFAKRQERPWSSVTVETEVRSVFASGDDDSEIADAIRAQLADDGLIETGQSVEVIDYASIGWMGDTYEVEFVTVAVS